MSDVINDYLEEYKETQGRYIYRPSIECADGFTMSVGASGNQHYCSPKSHSGPYESVEVGYPSGEEELLSPYAENPTDPTGIYSWVPVEIVNQVIEKHGGLS